MPPGVPDAETQKAQPAHATQKPPCLGLEPAPPAERAACHAQLRHHTAHPRARGVRRHLDPTAAEEGGQAGQHALPGAALWTLGRQNMATEHSRSGGLADAAAQHGALELGERFELCLFRRRTIGFAGVPDGHQRRGNLLAQMLHRAALRALDPSLFRAHRDYPHQLQRRFHADLGGTERFRERGHCFEPGGERPACDERRARQTQPLAHVLRLCRVVKAAALVGAADGGAAHLADRHGRTEWIAGRLAEACFASPFGFVAPLTELLAPALLGRVAPRHLDRPCPAAGAPAGSPALPPALLPPVRRCRARRGDRARCAWIRRARRLRDRP